VDRIAVLIEWLIVFPFVRVSRKTTRYPCDDENEQDARHPSIARLDEEPDLNDRACEVGRVIDSAYAR